MLLSMICSDTELFVVSILEATDNVGYLDDVLDTYVFFALCRNDALSLLLFPPPPVFVLVGGLIVFQRNNFLMKHFSHLYIS